MILCTKLVRFISFYEVIYVLFGSDFVSFQRKTLVSYQKTVTRNGDILCCVLRYLKLLSFIIFVQFIVDHMHHPQSVVLSQDYIDNVYIL